jgi:hypothetical protein
MNRTQNRLIRAGRVAVRVLFAFALLSCAESAAAAGHKPHLGPGGTPPPRGLGHLLPILADGDIREPSTDRAEATDDPDVLDAGDWDWDVSLASASADDIAGANTASFEVMNIDLSRGVAGGFGLGVRFEPWSTGQVEQGAAQTRIKASGLGPTTLSLRHGLFGGGDSSHVGLAISGWGRLPGQPDGPDTQSGEAGLSLPFAVRLDSKTKLGVMVEGDWAADAFDQSHHVDAVASIALKRQAARHLSTWIETVSVWSGEAGRPWLGVVDGGTTLDVMGHLGLTLGACGGLGGGVGDVGVFGRIGVHS